jgi:hypothetical protein
MWPKSYAQLLHRVAERLDAVDRTRLATSLGMVEYAQRGTGTEAPLAVGPIDLVRGNGHPRSSGYRLWNVGEGSMMNRAIRALARRTIASPAGGLGSPR